MVKHEAIDVFIMFLYFIMLYCWIQYVNHITLVFFLLSNKWKLAHSIVSQLFRNFPMDCVYSKDFIYKESFLHRSSPAPISQLAWHHSCGKNVQFHYEQHSHLYYKFIIPLWRQIFGNGNCRTAIGKKPRKQNIFFYILWEWEDAGHRESLLKSWSLSPTCHSYLHFKGSMPLIAPLQTCGV